MGKAESVCLNVYVVNDTRKSETAKFVHLHWDTPESSNEPEISTLFIYLCGRGVTVRNVTFVTLRLLGSDDMCGSAYLPLYVSESLKGALEPVSLYIKGIGSCTCDSSRRVPLLHFHVSAFTSQSCIS